MAKVKSPFAVKGKLGNLEFYMRDGKNYIRPARFLRPLPPDYYHIFIGQKRNRFGFAGAVAACSKIYSRLDNGPRDVMRPNAYNLIRSRLRQMLQFAPVEWRTNEWLGGSDHFDHDFDATSQWMPAHLLPEDGLTIAARPQDPLLQDVAYIICLTLQWREYRPVGPHLIHHPAQGTARLLSGQYAPEDQEPIQLITTRQQKLAESKILNTDCATDISQALAGML